MIYAYVDLKITDPESLAAYRDKAGAALARHGGAVLAASRAATALDGAPDLPDLAAILTFPDRDAAQAWIGDPDLAEVHALRRNAGRSDIVLLG